MPVPKPSAGESEDDFIARCMGDADMQEFDMDQRAAVCFDAYRGRSATSQGKGNAMAEKERLAELKRRRAEVLAKMKALVKQDEESDDTAPADRSTTDVAHEFEQLESLATELAQRIQRLETMMQSEADEAANGDGNGAAAAASFGAGTGTAASAGDITRGGMRVWAQPKGRGVDGTGFQFARYVIGLAHVKWYGHEKAAEWVMNRFNDSDVAKALNLTVVAEGGALIPQDFMADLIELLRAACVVRAASPMTVGMPMGNMTIPRLAGGSTALYQGELDDISLTEEIFDDLNLAAHKLTALVPVSNDLIRRAPIGVEQIVRDDLVQSVARKEDLTFLRGDGTANAPTGFRSLVLPANLLVIPVGGNLDAVVAGLSAMILTLQQGLSRMLRPQWFMAPAIARFISVQRDSVGGFYYKDEMAAGRLEGIPVSISQQIPTNLGTGNGSEITLVDMADVVIADTLNVLVDASDVAAYYGTDGKVVSTFQRDQSLFRVISEHDINMRHLQSLAIGTTSDWKFTGLPGVPGSPWSTQPLNPHWARSPAAWPSAVTHDAAPVIYDPAVVQTSAFAGTLTSQPGGKPGGAMMSADEAAAAGENGTAARGAGETDEADPPEHRGPGRPRGR